MTPCLLLTVVRAEMTPLRLCHLSYLSIKLSHSVLLILLTFFISFFLLSLTPSCFSPLLIPVVSLIHSFFLFFLSFFLSSAFLFTCISFFLLYSFLLLSISDSFVHSVIHPLTHSLCVVSSFLEFSIFFISTFSPYFLFIVSLWFSFPSIFSFFIYFSSFHVLFFWWTLFCKRGQCFHMLGSCVIMTAINRILAFLEIK